jgi:hypothetical protein
VAQTLGDLIKAYHGSPHDFDQFSMSKIGTGEGAQAYGHGLYFAGSKEVARGYRERLAGGDDYPNHLASEALKDANGDRQQAAQALSDYVRYKPTANPKDYHEAIDRLRHGIDVNPGRMYEVNLHAHPDEFLDWDKPLSQQSPQVQEIAMRQFRNVQPVQVKPGWYSVTRVGSDGVGRTMTSDILESTPQAAMQRFQQYLDSERGSNVYQRLGSPEEASAVLRQAGIKGIKYLDQGSRAAGEGTRNYVVFDDAIISIAKKYGIPLAAAAELYRQQQKQSTLGGVGQ